MQNQNLSHQHLILSKLIPLLISNHEAWYIQNRLLVDLFERTILYYFNMLSYIILLQNLDYLITLSCIRIQSNPAPIIIIILRPEGWDPLSRLPAARWCEGRGTGPDRRRPREYNVLQVLQHGDG